MLHFPHFCTEVAVSPVTAWETGVGWSWPLLARHNTALSATCSLSRRTEWPHAHHPSSALAVAIPLWCPAHSICTTLFLHSEVNGLLRVRFPSC
jgi:hypothetical protein